MFPIVSKIEQTNLTPSFLKKGYQKNKKVRNDDSFLQILGK